MPTKKIGFFDVSGKEPPKEKAPTLTQWLKENKDVQYPFVTPIAVIWLPGNWPNYSIEAGAFRVSISERHPLYAVLESNVVKVFSESETCVLLELMDSQGTIRFCESNVYGKYARLGNAGYRFDPTKLAN